MVYDEDIKQAKIKLFLLLLHCKDHDLSDNEVDIMYQLSIDRDIQEVLFKKIK